MRLLFTPLATPQHLYPIVPLAWACRAAGHEVRLAGTPSIVDAMVRTGLPAIPVGKDVPPASVSVDGIVSRIYQHPRFPIDWPLRPHLLDEEQRSLLEQLGRNSAVAAEAMVDDLIEYAHEWRPDIIVHDLANFAGPVAAAALGVPNVRHLTGVGLRPMETRQPGPEPLPEYVELFERRGLPVRYPPTLTLDPSPPSLRLPVASAYEEIRFVPYNGSGLLPDRPVGPPLPITRRPKVCVTWGLSVLRAALAIGPAALAPYRDALEALDGLDVETILVTGAEHLELLGQVPPGAQVLLSVPLQYVLPACDAIVHQAGDGTALTAAALGVPQLALTSKPDPALTGDRLAAVGAGVHLRYQDLAADPDRRERIRAAVSDLLTDPKYGRGAAQLRTEIERQPAPAELVPVLEALVRQPAVAGERRAR